MNTQTSDISLAAYLTLKGHQITNTARVGRLTTFIFSEDAEQIVNQWQLSPTDEMRTIQQYTTEKERLFKAIKESRNDYDY